MAQVNLALHLFAAIIMFIILLGCISEKRIDSHVPTPLLSMLVMNIMLLLSTSAETAITERAVYSGIWLLLLRCLIRFLFNAIFIEFLYYLKFHFSPEERTDALILTTGAILHLVIAVLRIVQLFAPGIEQYLQYIVEIFAVCTTVLTVWMLLRCRPNMNPSDQWVMLATLLSPVLGMVIGLPFPKLQLMPISVSFALILIYGFVHLNLAYRSKSQQLQLARSSMTIMLSQIRPHFLYNALNSIYVLCGKDPLKAREAISDFSEYLRANMGNTEKALITIDEELDHVRHYLALEQIRFGDQLQVIYDHKSHGFLIPPLSVQPLAENAVKHGLLGKAEGGTLKISTFEDELSYHVEVLDDGKGFDPDQALGEDRPHIGISNVKDRLQNACEGTLSIESSPDSGTRILITIPRVHSSKNSEISSRNR